MIGNILLYISIVFTIGAIVFVFLNWRRLSTWFVVGQSVAVVGMMGFLWWAFFANRFELQYVYQHSSISLEWFYKLVAVWAGSSGSLIFWMLTLTIIALYFAIKRPWNRSVLTTILVFQVFIFASIIIAHPFAPTLRTVTDGRGLNFFLKSFWMLSHPPVVFIAYSMLLAPFGFTIAYVLNKKMQFDQWREKVLPWVIASWFMLGLGIALGSVWAYEVIGWGGYWSWDPIENASLIPWILLSCGLHALIATKYSKTGKRSSIGYTLSSFVAVVLAVFMVRSGFLYRISVHAFATRPMAIVCTVMLLVSVVVSVYAYIKLKRRVDVDTQPPIGSKPFIISSWNVLMLLFVIIVLIASFWPALTLSIFDKGQPVSSSFYSKLAVPTGILILIGLIISSVIKWSRTSLKLMLKKLLIPVILGHIAIGVLIISPVISPVVIAITFHAVIAISAEIIRIIEAPFRMWGGKIAHIGVAILIVGIAFTSNCVFTQEVKLKVGDDYQHVAERRLKLEEITVDDESGDYSAIIEMVNVNDETKVIIIDGQWSSTMDCWLNQPAIMRSFAMDAILTPDTLEAGAELISSIGESVEVNGYSVTLDSIADDGINFKLSFEDDSWELSTEWNNEKESYEEVTVTDKLTIDTKIGVNEDYVTFTISDLRPQRIEDSGVLTIYLNYKYFVTFVWLGMFLALLGILWELIYRSKFGIKKAVNADLPAKME